MPAHDCCDECGRSLELVARDAVVRHRESTGFGAANERIRRFCSVECRARWRDVDPVLATTQQTTLAAFDGGNLDWRGPEAIAWGH